MGGMGSGPPTCGWGSAGPEGQWAQGEGQVSQRAVGPAPGWVRRRLVAGIPVVGWSWIWRQSQGAGIHACVGLEQSCGLAQPERQKAQQNGAVPLQTCGVGI
jgi:hypothetical protein